MSADDRDLRPAVVMEASALDELSRLNNELVNAQRALAKQNAELRTALARVRRLEGLLPICMHCHAIRSDANDWQRLEAYLSEHSDVVLSHGLCPACLEKHYPDGD